MRLHVSGKSAAGVFHRANFHVDLESNFLIGHYWFSCILFIQEIQPDTKQVFPTNVKMIYTYPDGRKYSDIIEGKVEYTGSRDVKSLRYQYSFFVDSALFTMKSLSKSFILLDENKNTIPTPSNFAISYHENENANCGYITFSEVV